MQSDAPTRSTSDVHARVHTPLRILVIDDEPMIGIVFQHAFAEDVVETFVEPALAVERAQVAPFDVVFCDLMMPTMTGIDVYEALLHSAPDLATRFVLMTGSLNTEAIAGFLSAHPVLLLNKPFRLTDLQHCVSRFATAVG